MLLQTIWPVIDEIVTTFTSNQDEHHEGLHWRWNGKSIPNQHLPQVASLRGQRDSHEHQAEYQT